jgi:hypothetical protein
MTTVWPVIVSVRHMATRPALGITARDYGPGRRLDYSDNALNPLVLVGRGCGDTATAKTALLKHDPEKCEAVFRKDHAQTRI